MPWVYGEQRNRPRDDIYKSEIHVSDENEGLIFPEIEVLQFRPKGIICFVHRIPPACGRQGGRCFSCIPYPGLRRELSRTATFRIVPPVPKFRDALGYIILALQARQKKILT